MHNVIYGFYCNLGGGGRVMDLPVVYSSSPSSYMECKVIFGDECLHICRSGVRLDQCFCVGDFVVGIIIFGSYFYGSTTFRMSTRRLPVILFVSCFECPLYPVVCCTVCLWWPRGIFTLYASIGTSVLYDSFIVFCLLSPSRRLRGLSTNLTARGYVKGYSVD